MLTPLLILTLLVLPWGLASLAGVVWHVDRQHTRTAGVAGITLVFLFTGVGHFLKTQAMAQMLPPVVPGRVPLVYATGVLEIALAGAVLLPRVRKVVGIALIVMLIVFLPVNIYAALEHVDLGGHRWGPIYLLVRIPLQLILILWIGTFAVRRAER